MRFLPLMLLGILICSANVSAESQWIYIASPAKQTVIYRASLDLETGEITDLEVAATDVKTGFMAVHPQQPILYAGTTEDAAQGEYNGGVRAYRINTKTGMLKEFSRGKTEDNGTTHIEVAPNGKVLAVCHYGGEGTSAIPLNGKGELLPTVSKVHHYGKSVDEKRQQEPHPHGVAFSSNSQYLLVADLGNDHVEVFKVQPKGQIQQHSYWSAKPGAGPRHITRHPQREVYYCINELDSTITVLKFDDRAGLLTAVQTVNTLPEDFTGGNTTAEVVVHPSGKFVYGSNRGHESTAVFKINPETEELTFVEREPTQGNHPRYVGLDPTGRIFLAANMQSDNLVSFTINSTSGELEPTGHQLAVARPMCVVFVPQEK